MWGGLKAMAGSNTEGLIGKERLLEIVLTSDTLASCSVLDREDWSTA